MVNLLAYVSIKFDIIIAYSNSQNLFSISPNWEHQLHTNMQNIDDLVVKILYQYLKKFDITQKNLCIKQIPFIPFQQPQI